MPSESTLGFALRPANEAMSEIVGWSNDSLPLSLISGLHREAEADLKRIGIFGVENLAVANPMLVLVKTSFAFPQILDWIGEALLLSYFGPERAGALRRFGVRTILNLMLAWDEEGPPAEVVRILCHSDDKRAIAFLRATLRSDPLVARLLELQEPSRARIVTMVMEAGAAARDAAKLESSKSGWFENLQALVGRAYGELAAGDRLRAVHPGIFIGVAIVCAWALAQLWQYGDAALAALAGLSQVAAYSAIPPAPGTIVAPGLLHAVAPATAALVTCGIAAAVLLMLVVSLYLAFNAEKASYKAYLFLTEGVIFVIGVLIGTLG